MKFRRPAQKTGVHISKERQDQPTSVDTGVAEIPHDRNIKNMQGKLIREN